MPWQWIFDMLFFPFCYQTYILTMIDRVTILNSLQDRRQRFLLKKWKFAQFLLLLARQAESLYKYNLPSLTCCFISNEITIERLWPLNSSLRSPATFPEAGRRSPSGAASPTLGYRSWVQDSPSFVRSRSLPRRPEAGSRAAGGGTTSRLGQAVLALTAAANLDADELEFRNLRWFWSACLDQMFYFGRFCTFLYMYFVFFAVAFTATAAEWTDENRSATVCTLYNTEYRVQCNVRVTR